MAIVRGISFRCHRGDTTRFSCLFTLHSTEVTGEAIGLQTRTLSSMEWFTEQWNGVHFSSPDSTQTDPCPSLDHQSSATAGPLVRFIAVYCSSFRSLCSRYYYNSSPHRANYDQDRPTPHCWCTTIRNPVSGHNDKMRNFAQLLHRRTFSGRFVAVAWELKTRHWKTRERTLRTRLTAPFPGLPRCTGTRKVKPIWILLKQETVSGSGVSWAVCKSSYSAPSRWL